MKRFFLLSTLLVTTAAWAAEPPHLDLEMSSQEYRSLVHQNQLLTFGKKKGPVSDALRAGEKLFTWLDLINSQRPDDQKIRLTSKDTRKGIPITKPNQYGPSTIEQDLNELRNDLPNPMREIIFSKKAPSADPLVEDKVFIEYGRRVDRLYQTAARWKMLSPYKAIYAHRKARDVRDYYYLKTNGWDADRLKADWSDLKGSELERVKKALAGLCLNKGDQKYKSCLSYMDRLSTGAEAAEFYSFYIVEAEHVWNSFYEIRNARPDIKWSGINASVAKVPFLNPKSAEVRSFIKDNIEDEFHWGKWGLKIDFVGKRPAPFVVFKAGATPNVNGLGGNRITMDANKSVHEYEVQWIIRHEFGHVLGIPDCYHEFYDRKTNLFINYQLDTSDLMCSRAGNMNERIYQQMKEAYAK